MHPVALQLEPQGSSPSSQLHPPLHASRGAGPGQAADEESGGDCALSRTGLAGKGFATAGRRPRWTRRVADSTARTRVTVAAERCPVRRHRARPSRRLRRLQGQRSHHNTRAARDAHAPTRGGAQRPRASEPPTATRRRSSDRGRGENGFRPQRALPRGAYCAAQLALVGPGSARRVSGTRWRPSRAIVATPRSHPTTRPGACGAAARSRPRSRCCPPCHCRCVLLDVHAPSSRPRRRRREVSGQPPPRRAAPRSTGGCGASGPRRALSAKEGDRWGWRPTLKRERQRPRWGRLSQRRRLERKCTPRRSAPALERPAPARDPSTPRPRSPRARESCGRSCSA